MTRPAYLEKERSAAAYRDAGLVNPVTNVWWQTGCFSVPKGVFHLRTRDLDLVLRAYTEKFVAKYQQMGWTLVSKPVIRKVPVIADTAKWWKTGLRESHPFNVPDRDRYEIKAMFQRPHQPASLLVSDETATDLMSSESEE